MRRFKRQHLPFLIQHSFQISQARACTRRNDQLGWFILDNAGVSCRIQHRVTLRQYRVAIKVFRAAAAYLQRGFLLSRCTNDCFILINNGLHGL